MARFKPYEYGQLKFIPVSFKEQILPGTFEYTLNHLIDHEIDLAVFEHRYQNDETGAPACGPAILLKATLSANSRGVTPSRQIERLARENVVFMALCADSAPHLTTIADFVATLDAEIVAVFRGVLLACEEAGPMQAARALLTLASYRPLGGLILVLASLCASAVQFLFLFSPASSAVRGLLLRMLPATSRYSNSRHSSAPL